MARLHLIGEVDMASVSLVDAELARLAADGPQPLFIDLSRVTFCDLAGYRALAAVCSDRGWTWVLLGRATEAVRRVFDFAGTGQLVFRSRRGTRLVA